MNRSFLASGAQALLATPWPSLLRSHAEGEFVGARLTMPTSATHTALAVPCSMPETAAS